ncbi:hypothetical protein ACROYT_G018256 [Oculina patagonica]
MSDHETRLFCALTSEGMCITIVFFDLSVFILLEEGISWCEDKDAECNSWSSRGHCQSYPGWMLINCPVACDVRGCKICDPKEG